MFIDADIIIRGNIDELWNTNLTNYSHAAVENPFISVEKKKTLGIPSKESYFNAGLLLINVEWWKQHKITENTITFLNKNKDFIEWWDQDVLNGTLHGKWKKVKPKSGKKRLKNVFQIDALSNLSLVV